MRIKVVATDYDDTVAKDGRIDPATYEALARVKETGRLLVLVTGRDLSELLALLERPTLFDRIVAENGALLYTPETGEVRTLAEPRSPGFVQRLRDKNVTPLAVGRVIVATREPFETVVLNTVHELGLELQVIFNKGAVMVLPSGVNKATGLKHALKELGLAMSDVAAIGDAENDNALLQAVVYSGAVANALPSLKERAHYVCQHERGLGVAEFIDTIIAKEQYVVPAQPGVLAK